MINMSKVDMQGVLVSAKLDKTIAFLGDTLQMSLDMANTGTGTIKKVRVSMMQHMRLRSFSGESEYMIEGTSFDEDVSLGPRSTYL